MTYAAPDAIFCVPLSTFYAPRWRHRSRSANVNLDVRHRVMDGDGHRRNLARGETKGEDEDSQDDERRQGLRE